MLCHSEGNQLAKATTTADEFSEEGRSADGGLRNGDLLIPQKCARNHFTDGKLRTRKFITVQFWHYLLLPKGSKKKF